MTRHQLSNNKNGVGMKRKMTAIVAGAILAITGATLPALATVANTNSQHLTDAESTQRTVVTRSAPSSKLIIARFRRRGRPYNEFKPGSDNTHYLADRSWGSKRIREVEFDTWSDNPHFIS